MLYALLKHLHVACVTLSLAGFCLRGWGAARNSALAGRRWLRVAPHVVDTLLLGAGIGLALTLRQYPFVDGWLTAKFFGLVAYIILGSLALKPGRDGRLRLAAGVAAVIVFGWIVSVAFAKSPLGALAWLR